MVELCPHELATAHSNYLNCGFCYCSHPDCCDFLRKEPLDGSTQTSTRILFIVQGDARRLRYTTQNFPLRPCFRQAGIGWKDSMGSCRKSDPVLSLCGFPCGSTFSRPPGTPRTS